MKIKNAGYNVVSMWVCEFRKLLREHPVLENELCSHPNVRNSTINIRDAMYGYRTESNQTYYRFQEGENIHYVDITCLYPYICKYGVFPSGHSKVHVSVECPPDCFDR